MTIAVNNNVELIAAIKANPGAVIGLNAGAWGSVTLAGLKPTVKTTLTCAPGARFERLKLVDSDNLKIIGPQVIPTKAPASIYNFLIEADKASDNIEIEGATVMSFGDAMSYRSWDAPTWRARRVNGISLAGINSHIRTSLVTGIRIGLIVYGSGSSIDGNKVRGIAEDGMRCVGSGTGYLLRGNDLADWVNYDGIHNDGGQSWGTPLGSGVIHNQIYESNLIREWIGPANPLHHAAQGLSFFDGIYDGLKFIGNEIWSNHWHGITAYKCKNVLLDANRVYHMARSDLGKAWIKMRGTNIRITNNVAGLIDAPGAVMSGNTKPDYATLPAMSLAA